MSGVTSHACAALHLPMDSQRAPDLPGARSFTIGRFSSEPLTVLEGGISPWDEGTDRRFHVLPNLFYDLVAQWKERTRFQSNMHIILNDPAYRRILSLGLSVVPLILWELQKQPDHWSHALATIFGVDPVPEEAAGDLARLRQIWLDFSNSTKR